MFYSFDRMAIPTVWSKLTKWKAFKKNLIKILNSETVRDRAKQTEIWDHKGYKSQIRNIFKNSKFYKKNQNGLLDQNAISLTVRDRAKQTKIWDHKGYKRLNTNILKVQNFIKKRRVFKKDWRAQLTGIVITQIHV